jgi:hypothetical protein
MHREQTQPASDLSKRLEGEFDGDHRRCAQGPGPTNALSPGLNTLRLSKLLNEAKSRCRLDLSDAVVLTEAASGAYSATPVLAAMAGAKKVFAVARSSPFGSVEDVTRHVIEVAQASGVPGIIEVVTEKSPDIVSQADVVTNSGHVRPLDSEMVKHMKSTAVVPLMYESWELRDSDVDLEACRRKGILVAGTNERIPAVDVFSYLGIMAVKMLVDAGVAVYGSHVLLLCDNPFGPYIKQGLISAGASVQVVQDLSNAVGLNEIDAILVAIRPRVSPILGMSEAKLIAERCPWSVVCQFWGDVDREALQTAGLWHWPTQAPASGHMGILPSEVGPEPIVRLQAGGLKVAEVLMRMRQGMFDHEWEFVDAIGENLPRSQDPSIGGWPNRTDRA